MAWITIDVVGLSLIRSNQLSRRIHDAFATFRTRPDCRKMPRAKRPLVEADQDSMSSRSSTTPVRGKPRRQIAEGDEEEIKRRVEATSPLGFSEDMHPKAPRFKARKLGEIYSRQTQPAEGDNIGKPAIRKEIIQYNGKDDCKLRALLRDRNLTMTGTRAELIARLENSSIDYDSLLSDELAEMLRKRNSKYAGSATKAVKISLLRADDKMNWDRGNYEAMMLYVHRGLVEQSIADKKSELEIISHETYKSLNAAQLKRRLGKASLSCNGSEAVLARRLYDYDRKGLTSAILKLEKDLKARNEVLETKVGHPISNEDFHRGMDDYQREESEVLTNTKEKAPKRVPICDYDWKDSHWAGRTDRELRTITERRGMPGSGPKAAMLKWLDTGEIDYEDMYVGSLSEMCQKRGLPGSSKDKKSDLVQRLRDADEVSND